MVLFGLCASFQHRPSVRIKCLVGCRRRKNAVKNKTGSKKKGNQEEPTRRKEIFPAWILLRFISGWSSHEFAAFCVPERFL